LASSGTAADVPGLSDSLGFFLQWSDAAQTAGTELLFSNSSPNVEKVIEYEPDLIVVAETGGDSLMDNVDQLRKIAPVMVVNYSGSSWQDITTLFGEATGAEDQAMQAIMQYEAQLAAVKASITVPDHPVSAFFPFASGEGAGAATEFSPHTQILADLGFTLAEIPDEVKGDESMGGAERKDIVNLSAENLQRGLPGETWIMIAADAAAKDLVNTDPAYTSAPAVQAGNVFFTPGETFRLDFFSALILLDSLAQSFAS
ncbi:Fe2+-enterobactin ABC transporter substrate-binding protein, partial [Leucobacter sp. M11]|uniref:Fe2+-enterobactin ABC transporter substrate-binding protein n=1 Tax=Leucobacter sp. M11 TaxID=2993565 RepID=UPI002D7F270A